MSDKITSFPDEEHEVPLMMVNFQGEILANYKQIFSGFDELKAITFSYDLGFIQEISDYFREMTIILGCEALVRDDAFDMVLESQRKIITEITRYKKLVERVRDGSVTFKIAKKPIDHEKLFIMSCYDSEHTSVLAGSANFTRRGFSGPGTQRELILYMPDDPGGYDYACAEFDAVSLECVNEVPEKTILSAQNGELSDEEVPVAEEILVHNVTLFLEGTDFDDDWNETAFITNIMDSAGREKKYFPKITNGSKKREITPQIVKTAAAKKKEDEKKQQEARRNYSTLHVDYDKDRVFFDGKEYDLVNIDMEKVRSDLEIMGKYFDGYDGFIGDSFKMKQTYFKLMNFMLLSPFIARLRSTAYFNEYPPECFPYYALVRGTTNAGKTEFVRTVQRLMTGKRIPVLSCENFKVAGMQGLLAAIEGLPMCLDDMNGNQFKQADSIVKNDIVLYNDKFIHHGTFIITTNNIKDPKPEISKRMFSLTVTGTQPNEDAVAKKRPLNLLLKNLTTSFYCAYLKKMLPAVHEMIYRMQTGDVSDDVWQPDIFRTSSDIIIEIYKDCGMKAPDYVSSLSYNDYFGEENLCGNFKDVILNAWRLSPEAFRINRKGNVLEYTVSGYESEAEDLMRIIPSSLHPQRSRKKIIMDLDKTEEFCGTSFRKGWFRR